MQRKRLGGITALLFVSALLGTAWLCLVSRHVHALPLKGAANDTARAEGAGFGKAAGVAAAAGHHQHEAHHGKDVAPDRQGGSGLFRSKAGQKDSTQKLAAGANTKVVFDHTGVQKKREGVAGSSEAEMHSKVDKFASLLKNKRKADMEVVEVQRAEILNKSKEARDKVGTQGDTQAEREARDSPIKSSHAKYRSLQRELAVQQQGQVLEKEMKSETLDGADADAARAAAIEHAHESHDTPVELGPGGHIAAPEPDDAIGRERHSHRNANRKDIGLAGGQVAGISPEKHNVIVAGVPEDRGDDDGTGVSSNALKSSGKENVLVSNTYDTTKLMRMFEHLERLFQDLDERGRDMDSKRRKILTRRIRKMAQRWKENEDEFIRRAEDEKAFAKRYNKLLPILKQADLLRMEEDESLGQDLWPVVHQAFSQRDSGDQ
ncbi:hypothetical protein FVE85_8098 [Porphyridium purpureum]|uniref:Uncharacterized protein n=1 Tax=Porphyridium purpureum TaxID=35688 RepID=A0A5J4YM80_PORPP|nr:hypothetical protein FVE85_8098 [Porphyridium purpureum]|eukprot:POR2998..scf295_9